MVGCPACAHTSAEGPRARRSHRQPHCCLRTAPGRAPAGWFRGAVPRVSGTASSRHPLPDSLVVRFGEEGELAELAADLGAVLSPCFAYQGASLLPSSALVERTSAPEYGAPLEQYDFEHCRYLPVRRPQHDGLYRLKRRDSKQVCQVLRSGDWYETTHEHGVYAVLANQNSAADVLRWLPEKTCGRKHIGTLFVDWGYPLPDLHRRVAAMCSGLAPRINEGAQNLAYDNVPKIVAMKIADSLGQVLGDSSE